MNPFWTGKNIVVHRDVRYSAENVFSKPENVLDIYSSTVNSAVKLPVLIYLHGGYWISGDKTKIPTFVQYMAIKKWIVVAVDYRSEYSFPNDIVDVKQAIAWIKSNIHKYGGDPSFIAISGSDSGAHLATMVALTANDFFYQPGFENVDTSINVCIGFNPILNLQSKRHDKSFQSWFSKTVLKINDHTKALEIMKAYSPSLLLDEMDTNRKKKANGISISQSTNTRNTPRRLDGSEQLVPFLFFHGKLDKMCPWGVTRDFVKRYTKLDQSPISMSFIALPFTGSSYEQMSCPRGHYVAYAIDRWLLHFYSMQRPKQE